MKMVLTESALSVDIHTAPDGYEALAFLRREGQYATAPRPDLVLLDINLPRKNGLEVLAEVKKDRHLKRIPVVMLTASERPEDIHTSYELGANGYVKKPWGLAEYRAVAKELFAFWCNYVVLPPK